MQQTTYSVRPRIAITAGDPAGIGPDIILQLDQQDIDAEIVVIASSRLLSDRADQLGKQIELVAFDPDKPASPEAGRLYFIEQELAASVVAGKTEPKNARYVLNTISAAVQGCLSGEFSAMVTAPVNKASINDSGFEFSGHTEFIASLCGCSFPVMMLANDKLRVALVTTHLPLSRVADAITSEHLEQVITIVHNELERKFNIKTPQILVCGLNPHAGEQGYLGHEEIDIINPVLTRLRQSGLSLTGPVPADTAFTQSSLNGIDAVIAMYHDQGLPVLKAQGFGEIVNITLGLPIIRTSVDHGTALTLAGTGQADSGSLKAAIQWASRMSIMSQQQSS